MNIALPDAAPATALDSGQRVVDRLAAHTIDLKWESLDAETIGHARLRLIDVLSCCVGGATAPGNLPVLDLFRSWGGAPQATVLAHGDRLPLHYAAMMNSLTARSFDFEATGPEAEGVNAGKMVGHVPSTTEPTALAVGEFHRVSGKDLLAAVVVGGDIGARIAVSDEFNFDKCFEVCGTANAFGATALAGRLMGLTPSQLANAFGILLHMMSGSFQSLWDGVHAFKLPGALAAQNAVMAVEMSRRGFGGVRDALESPQGYYPLFCNNPSPSMALADLGEVFYVKGMHKLHPSCYGNHNPIESALEIVRKHAFDFREIREVRLEVPPNRIKHFLNQSCTANDEQPRMLFSIPYAVANVLMRRDVRIEHYTEPMIRVPELLALCDKVRLAPVLTASKTHAGRLVVELQNGQSFDAFRETPLGWADNPVPAEEVQAKYWRNIEFARTIDTGAAREALAMLLDLENVQDVSALPALLSRKN